MTFDNKAQTSAEFLLIFGSLILIIIASIGFISSENELTMAMVAARNGINEGTASAVSAIYSSDAYNEYSKEGNLLLIPFYVEIVNISYVDLGHDSAYDKQKIQFKVYAHSSKDLDKKELDSIGDRINYNLRKSIALTFESTKSTNKLYNPVFSPHHVFTTANVKWV
ncbi:MAG: hypothetical protein K6A34_01030 [Methanobrevibacter sp.]|nr:hypothetical protein [Methanobrevibacter sp.]